MKKIERKFVGEPASYDPPKTRIISISLCNHILANSVLDGDTIEDVTEEDNPFFN